MNPPNSVSSSLDVRSESEIKSSDSAGTAMSVAGLHLFSFLLGALMATIFIGGSLFLLRRPDPPPIVLQPPPTPLPTDTPAPTATPAPITVFVSGAVSFPGLYLLAADARVGDAIESAGGLTQDADAVIVNQAEKLWDGAQVHVPAVASPGIPPTDGAADDAGPRLSEPPAGVSGPANGTIAESGPGTLTNQGVDINSGSLAELETLPGIGPSKAQAILDNRPFAAIDELARVPGIGAKTVEQLRDLVIVK
jgi:competence protein ComEA